MKAAKELIDSSRRLSRRLSRQTFGPPVDTVYNPLTYAKAPWEAYLERYARRGVDAVLVGMNPGPFGMAQTGVPFGEVEAVRSFLGIEARVGKPRKQHPKRPIQGFACQRSEVSGQRVWDWVAARFETPEAFFARFFIANYCPLVFMEASGRNRTPDKLPAAEREPLFAACDQALRETVAAIGPRLVIGVGAFAEARAKAALEDGGPTVGRILHPSPASPLANRDWAGQAEQSLIELGLNL